MASPPGPLAQMVVTAERGKCEGKSQEALLKPKDSIVH